MAVLCPHCEQIHFPPHGMAEPLDCPSCGGDLTAAKTAPEPEVEGPRITPPLASPLSLPTMLLGIAITFAGVCFGIIGKQKYDAYEKTTVHVRVVKYVDKVSDVAFARYTYYKYDTSASYYVNGVSYPYKLEASAFKYTWADGEKFESYYDTDNPKTTAAFPPVAHLACGIATALLGVGIIGFAVKVGI
jgi:hypothetical protein